MRAIVAVLLVVSATGGARQLVLQPTDVGAGAKPDASETGTAVAVRDLGSILPAPAKALLPRSDHYQRAYRLKSEEVVSSAFVFGSAATARTVYAAIAKRFGRYYHRKAAAVRLGDSQVAGYVVANALQDLVFARKGAVVWSVSVLDYRGATPAEQSRAFARMLVRAQAQQARVG